MGGSPSQSPRAGCVPRDRMPRRRFAGSMPIQRTTASGPAETRQGPEQGRRVPGLASLPCGLPAPAQARSRGWTRTQLPRLSSQRVVGVRTGGAPGRRRSPPRPCRISALEGLESQLGLGAGMFQGVDQQFVEPSARTSSATRLPSAHPSTTPARSSAQRFGRRCAPVQRPRLPGAPHLGDPPGSAGRASRRGPARPPRQAVPPGSRGSGKAMGPTPSTSSAAGGMSKLPATKKPPALDRAARSSAERAGRPASEHGKSSS